ncbi:Phage integrase [Moritella sp. JT01]|nr:Phage integrase [Moritella sp. JT01]
MASELSISSQNHVLLWMKVLFNQLRRLKELNQPNPLEDVKTIKTAERELSYLSHDQIAELLTFVQSSPISAQMTQIIKICLATGARIIEAIDIKVCK